MKHLVLFLALTLTAFAGDLPASTALPPLPIKGDLKIAFNTRVQKDGDKPKAGVADVYTLNVNIANSALFRGTISHRPYIANTIGSNQPGQLTFDVDCDVVNPANPAQTRNIGKLFGTVPCDKMNVYRFADGNARVSIFGAGSAKGFESRFNGLALGKPPAVSKLSQMQQQAVRLVSGKGGAITLTKYDKMEFQGHVIPAGPVQIYPEATVTGTLYYDYNRSAWHFNNVLITYASNGKPALDNLTGNIRWIESPTRKTNGEGRYDFDIRVNEPMPTEAAVFAATTDEASFFAADDVSPTLTGTMTYKDSITAGTVVASNVQINLVGNRLTKQQVMHLFKILFLSAVVPFNAE